MKKIRIRNFANQAVADVYATIPEAVRKQLLAVRELIFEIASADKTIGEITEKLKWNEPAYLTEATGSGTTVRLNRLKDSEKDFGVYVHCQTNIVEKFRRGAGKGLRFEKNRALLLSAAEALPKAALKEYLHSALTYHSRK
jgi:Domain of unknown function (DU1801)